MSKAYLAVAALVAAVAVPLAHGQDRSTCRVSYRDEAPLRLGSRIGLDLDETVSDDVVERAVSLWEACPGYGDEFPHFLLGGEGDRNYTIQLERRRPGEGHCATVFRGEIVLYETARDTRGRLRPCGALDENLAHELGHVLGLGHGEDRRGCRQMIMSTISSAHSRNLEGRSVHPAECAAVAKHWRTWAEHREIEERLRSQRAESQRREEEAPVDVGSVETAGGGRSPSPR